MGKISLPTLPLRTELQSKRAAGAPIDTKATKIPRVSDLQLERPSRSFATPQRLPVSAPVIMTIYKVTDQASDVWPNFAGTAATLWQMQIKHDAKPSITFDMVGSFNEFLSEARAKDETIPASLSELQQSCGVKLVIANGEDPQRVGFVPWRPSFYVAGPPEIETLAGFLNLLDQFFVFKAAKIAKPQPFEVSVHPHIGIDVSTIAEDFEYPHYVINTPAKILPMSFFEGQPVVGRGCITVHIECHEQDSLSMIFAGNTWNFRTRLDDCNVLGSHRAENGEYLRVLKGVDVTDVAEKTRAKNLFGEAAFNGLAIKVVIAEKPSDDSAAAAFIDELRDLPQLHFVST